MAAGNRQSRIKALRCISSNKIVCAVAALVLSACQPRPESLLQDYHTRLQRVLQITPAQPAPLHKTALPPLPDIRTVSLAIAPATIDLTDMLALDVCDLETLIAERNSSLGKVQTDAALLHYELVLLVRLDRCLHTPALASQLAPELHAALRQIYQQKQQQLPAVFANLLSRDQTLRQQLAGSQRGVAPDQGGLAETVQALNQLNTLRRLILQQDYQAASQTDIINALATLHRSQLIADVQHSLRLSQQFFLQLNQQLAQISATQLCKTDTAVRENLLNQIFIGRVQAELARVDGMTTELLTPLLQLYQQHPLQLTVQQRLQMPQASLQQQLRQHVVFWQRWRQCDLHS